jgi:hypothetical protein
VTNKGLTATKKGNTDKGMQKYSKILRVALNMGRKEGEVTNFSPVAAIIHLQLVGATLICVHLSTFFDPICYNLVVFKEIIYDLRFSK